MKLAVDDLVVHGAHGVGRVAAMEERVVLGTKQDVVVIELEDGLMVTLPLALARAQLRPAASDADMRRVRQTLRDDRELSADPWLSRRRETLGKLTARDPVLLAEIVSDGAQRQRLRQAKGTALLSSDEKEIVARARKLLSGEVALALGIEPTAADGWIDEQLARPAA